MRCPIDGETLVMADRNGVEIDYCPKCRGVWLDRGELDKIIERAAVTEPAVALREPGREPGREPSRGAAQVYAAEPRRDEPRRRDRDDDDDHRPRKRRESFLSELFDF